MGRFAEALQSIAATLWVGAMWGIGYIVAPLLFSRLGDRALAGLIAGKLFSLIAWVGIACAIYLLLFTSLIGCVIPRARHHYKALRSRPPRTPARLSRLSEHRELTLPRGEGQTDPAAHAIDVAADEGARVEPVGLHNQLIRVEAEQPRGARELRRRQHHEPIAPVSPAAHPLRPGVGVRPARGRAVRSRAEGLTRRDALAHVLAGLRAFRRIVDDFRRRLLAAIILVHALGMGDIADKFRGCATFAGASVPQADGLFAAWRALSAAPSVPPLIEMLAKEPR